MRRHALAPVLAVAPALLMAAPGHADWPTAPETPLAFSVSEPFGTPVPVVAADPHGGAWVAWVDHQCFGGIRLQHITATGDLLAPEGLAVDAFLVCNTPTVQLTAAANGDAIIAMTPDNGETPGALLRYTTDGDLVWARPVAAPVGAGAMVTELLPRPNGDIDVVWRLGAAAFVERIDPTGERVWPAPVEIPTTTSNYYPRGVADDGAGGLYLMWETGLAYTRLIWVARITADGAAAWPAPLQLTDVTPHASRHTPSRLAIDGEGGLLVVWTVGAETALTPMPLRMQRVAPDGARQFEAEGRPISLANTRQYDAAVVRHDDRLYIAWRDGQPGEQTLRAQSVDFDAERQWGDAGVGVAAQTVPNLSPFTLGWRADALSLVFADDVDPGAAALRLQRLTPAGDLLGSPAPLSDDQSLSGLNVADLADGAGGLVVCWRGIDLATPVHVHRVNPDGSIGPPSQPADLNSDGAVDAADLAALLAAWGECPACPEDLDRDDIVGPGDLAALLAAWSR